MLNNIRENFRFGIIFVREIFLLNLLIILFAVIYPGFDEVNWNTFAAGLLVVNSMVIPILGARNKRQFRVIRNSINKIRENLLSDAEDVKMPAHLSKLERDIRAMFERSQSDIAELRRLENVRKEFLGNVSHELRTPVFAIQGFIETLLGGALEDEKVNRKFLKKARRHTKRLSDLLNDLIEISMIESGEMKMSFRYFNLAELLSSVVEEFSPAFEEKKLLLEASEMPEQLEVYGDKNRLQQVFTNLVQNALKYTERGGVRIEIIEETDFVQVRVSDSGIGIPENDLARIFERFYRVDKQRSREVGGTGLGLAIVKHIIEAHGSRVEVSSEFGRGSTFSFRIPKESKYS